MKMQNYEKTNDRTNGADGTNGTGGSDSFGGNGNSDAIELHIVALRTKVENHLNARLYAY